MSARQPKLDLARYQQLAASTPAQAAGRYQRGGGQQEALVQADQARSMCEAISAAKIIAPLSGRAGLRQVDRGNIIRASGVTGLVIITQCSRSRCSSACRSSRSCRFAAKGALAVDVFGKRRHRVDTAR
jgi:multidrug efflux system membrane fusion protein